MELKEHCTIFIDLSHLSVIERRTAASWAFDKFGIDNVDVMRPVEKIGRYGVSMTPGFWFAHEKDAMWFTLKWSK